jgi:hypothetical protein
MARWRRFSFVMGIVTLTAGLLTAVFVSPASACSCIPSSEGERYARADHVFEGRVVSEAVEPGDPANQYDDKIRYAVKVRKEYKGNVPKRVDVATQFQGSLCGLRMTVGKDYLVFATGDSSDRRVETYLCSGTRLASGGPPVTTTTGTTTTTTPTCSTAPAP